MMSRLREALRSLFGKQRAEREMEEELRLHLEAETEANLRAGTSAEEARRRALVEFGGMEKTKEEVRALRPGFWLETLQQDLRYAWRSLRRSPGFTLTAVLILSLGTGINLAFFQMLNVAVLQPLPVKDPDTLVRLLRRGKTFRSSGVPYPATQFHRRNNHVLSATITQAGSDVAWGDNAADRARANFVSANYFDELGYRAALGRLFTETVDEAANAPPVVVLSYDFWQTRLGSDRDIIGKVVRPNNRPATVVGVAPRNLPDLGMHTFDLWLPIHQMDYFVPGTLFKETWGSNNTEMFGRLRPAVTPEAAKEGLRATVLALSRMEPKHFKDDEWLEVLLATQRFRDPADRKQTWVVVTLIGGLTLLVLLVACSNLGNLVLSRASYRLREYCIRAALGAGRWRIVRQILTEHALLAALGASGGLLAGVATARLIATRTGLPAFLDFSPDWRTFAAGGALSLFSAALLGLIPALRIGRQDLTVAMKDGAQQTSSSLARTRLRKILVGAQVAGSCALLIVAALMVAGLQRLITSPLGFEFANVAVLNASPGQYGLKGESARIFWQEVKRQLAGHPEVEGLALSSLAPLGGSISETRYNDAPGLKVTRMEVDPEFFPLMKIRILAGRGLLPGDDHRRTVVIGRRLAQGMYGTTDVIGKSFPKTEPRATIVGVTGDARLIKFSATDVTEEYTPLPPADYGRLLLVVGARTDPAVLLGPMRDAARRADDRVLAEARTLRSNFERRMEMPRLSSAISGGMGILTLSLACLGIFGLVSFDVALRTREIGIRVALGAEKGSIIGLLMKHLICPVGIGAACGALVGVLIGGQLAGDPFYLNPMNPAVYLATLVVLAATSALAALLPARRATRIDPMASLRHE